MKKILLYARDPGGVNTIIPLIEPLRQKGYDVLIYAKDTALVRFAANGITAKDISAEVGEISPESVGKFLLDSQPDFIITGTSADDMTEKYLWVEAKKLGIPSFAILDQWINYGIRFSNYGVSDIQKYSEDKEHYYLPTKILVMDDMAKREAICEGLPEDLIIVSGQPYFEYLKHKKFNQADLDKIKDKYHIKSEDFVAVFASEPIREIYKETLESEHFWGYDEISIFKHFFEALVLISSLSKKKIKLIIKLHPKEHSEHYAHLISGLKQDNITVDLDRDSNSQDIIKIADLICGMSSMFLLESYLLGKPTLSIQIGLNQENPFILDRAGIIKSILTQEQLNHKISAVLTGEESESSGFKLIEDPVKRVIDSMERILD